MCGILQPYLSRSFAVDTYHVKSGGRRVTVRSYYEKDCKQGGKLAGQAAKKAMETFGKMYGMYPYENFCVVQTDFFIGGMEYPGLVLLDQSLYTGQGLADLERVSVHENGAPMVVRRGGQRPGFAALAG